MGALYVPPATRQADIPGTAVSVVKWFNLNLGHPGSNSYFALTLAKWPLASHILPANLTPLGLLWGYHGEERATHTALSSLEERQDENVLDRWWAQVSIMVQRKGLNPLIPHQHTAAIIQIPITIAYIYLQLKTNMADLFVSGFGLCHRSV